MVFICPYDNADMERYYNTPKKELTNHHYYYSKWHNQFRNQLKVLQKGLTTTYTNKGKKG